MFPTAPWILPFPWFGCGWGFGMGTQPMLSDDCMTLEQKFMCNAHKIKELEDRVKALEEKGE